MNKMLVNKKFKNYSSEIQVISLVGMMGAGKSKFGKTLSRKLGFKFYEIDEMIEESFQMSINNIFTKYGEKHFRSEEKKLIKLTVLNILKNKENSLISTGGGSFDNQYSRELLLTNSLVIWLNCPIEVLVKRIGNTKKRPMLKENVKDSLQKVFEKREMFYKTAHAVFDTSESPFEQITEQMIKYIKKCLFIKK